MQAPANTLYYLTPDSLTVPNLTKIERVERAGGIERAPGERVRDLPPNQGSTYRSRSERYVHGERVNPFLKPIIARATLV